jgi:hypothetical protein
VNAISTLFVLSALMRVKLAANCGRIYKKRVGMYRPFFYLLGIISISIYGRRKEEFKIFTKRWLSILTSRHLTTN